MYTLLPMIVATPPPPLPPPHHTILYDYKVPSLSSSVYTPAPIALCLHSKVGNHSGSTLSLPLSASLSLSTTSSGRGPAGAARIPC